MDDHDNKRYSYGPAAVIFGVVVLLYFLCPYLFAWPFVMVYGKTAAPPPVERALFWPITYLADNVPTYAQLLEWESGWFGF